MTKATNTYLEYVIIIAFPLQQWLHERASMLRYTYISCPVIRDMECVYCAVRTGYLYIILRFAHTVYLCVLCGSENKQRLLPYTTTDWFL